MKPAPFAYHAPDTLEQALDLLHEHGWDAKVLAGGQSLIPTMNFRLAQPAVLVDLNRVAGLDFVRQREGGGVSIGAMTRQRRVEIDPLVAQVAPLVHETMPHIAHPQIRSRGTFGGSIAHADPAAELPAVALTLDARMRIRSAAGDRLVPAADFFLGLLTTALEPGEILTEVEIPALPDHTGVAFEEVARRHGDFALVGAMATVTLDATGHCCGARIGLLSVGDGPQLAERGAAALVGTEVDDASIAAAAQQVATSEIDPPADIHATAEFRRHLAAVVVGRVLRRARDRARATLEVG